MQLDRGASDAALDRFLADVGEDELERRLALVYDACQAILDGTWTQLYEHHADLALPTGIVLVLAPDAILVWRVNLERPGFVQVVYVGPP